MPQGVTEPLYRGRKNCQVWWHYLLVLLQYWKDADSPYPYGGPLCHDSKLMMFMYYCIKHLLCMGHIDLHHSSIKNLTPWTTFARQHYSTAQVTKQCETYATICEQLVELKDTSTMRQTQRSERCSSAAGTLGRCPHPETRQNNVQEMKICSYPSRQRSQGIASLV